MSWVDIENAMHSAIVRASGYPAERVIWSFQNINAPTEDYIEINFGGAISIGQDWIRNKQDLNRPNGQEIRQDIHGVREVPFDVSVFTSDTTGDAAARHVADLVRTKLRLDSVRSGMRKAGVSPFDASPVSWVPDIPNADFRGRAAFTQRCYVPVIDCFEYVGYIARVRGTVYPSGLYGYSGQATAYAFDSLRASGHTGTFNPP